MSAKSSESSLVGDTRFDLRAAETVGVRFVGVAWGIDSPDVLRSLGATTIVDSPAQLADALSGNAGAL